ncbi:MAG: 50S ribosomal protein L17 [Ignavibacteria bacterium]|nr:MAG: 50S ribosomal protein L17 [Ignavibacteria bacterium]
MRHAKVGRRLSRSASHRKALLAALSTALIKHKKIRTTAAKAKETRRIVEPLITRARNAYLREQAGEPVDVHARREIAKFIQDKDAVQLLFSEIAEKVGKRAGGYTRVLKLGHRQGDAAEMAIIELVDYNEAQDSKQRKERAARSKAAAARRKAAEERKAKAETEAAAVADEAAEAADDAAEVAEDAAAEVKEATEAVAEAAAPADEASEAKDAGDEAAEGEKEAPKA